MMPRPPLLEASFLAIQRARLLALRIDLARLIDREAAEADQVLTAARGSASETEDSAQDLTLTDNDRLKSSRLGLQRAAIDRALSKLEEGTYGFSDVSGLPIPLARLQAFPQAVRTTDEESGAGR